MPYIKQNDRKQFDEILEKVRECFPQTAGELNYLISSICKICLDHSDRKYQNYNDTLGALEGVKLELYRRYISDYEDQKIQENGDI